MKELKKHKKATAQESISIGAIRDVVVILPSMEEQREIVRILENIFKEFDKSEEILSSLNEQIEFIRKSILARAFRGELGTNDPNEESAIELLKTIL